MAHYLRIFLLFVRNEAQYEKAYRAQMRRPAAARLIALLAAMSRQTNLSIGCYCENPAKCHRSILANLLADAGAKMERPE